MPSLKDIVGVGEELVGYGSTLKGPNKREPGQAQKMRDLLSNKDFNKLSQSTQIQYFGKIFPDFQNLTPGQFQLVRNRASESPLVDVGTEAAANYAMGEAGGKLAGETLSAVAPYAGKAGRLMADFLPRLPKRVIERREARALAEAEAKYGKRMTKAPPLQSNIPDKPEVLSKPRTQAPPLRPNIPEKSAPPARAQAPPLRPNIPEKELPRRMSAAPSLQPNVAKTAQEVGRTTTPAPPLRPNIPSKELEGEVGEETEKISKPRLSVQTAKESPKTSQLSTPKTSSAPSDLETQLKKSLESPKAKPPEPPPAEKKDYTKTDKYAKDKAAKNEAVVAYLKNKGVSKQKWSEASLDQKNKWIREAVGSKHTEYKAGTEKALSRTKEIEDLLPDIDAQQRYGTSETPEVKKFLGHK